ncbi:hypothetical protein JX266_007777 [Neoarthrinium moseri]|nr:hypothetical protein JX266_007777 [Neoarthrinium moseri]
MDDKYDGISGIYGDACSYGQTSNFGNVSDGYVTGKSASWGVVLTMTLLIGRTRQELSCGAERSIISDNDLALANPHPSVGVISGLGMGPSTVLAATPTVYFIRHGEKPADDDETGLSADGEKRAQCLRSVFGASSGYDIGHIMAQTPKSDGSRQRPYDTVLPLATDLGLKVDTSCDRDDEDCVADVVKSYSGSGNILICWEHKQLNNLAEALGAKDVDGYPDDSFDLIWTDPYDWTKITDITSENCPGLDD